MRENTIFRRSPISSLCANGRAASHKRLTRTYILALITRDKDMTKLPRASKHADRKSVAGIGSIAIIRMIAAVSMVPPLGIFVSRGRALSRRQRRHLGARTPLVIMTSHHETASSHATAVARSQTLRESTSSRSFSLSTRVRWVWRVYIASREL